MVDVLKAPLHGSHTNSSSLFSFRPVALCHVSVAGQPRVAVIREEGSNGDREMCVSLYMAGFEVTLTQVISSTSNSYLNILVHFKVICSNDTTLLANRKKVN